MKKGISAIIATILLLLITIALAGSAYVYVSGMLTGKTSKTISVLDVSCTDGDITIVLSNDGTADISDDEIKVFINNQDKSDNYYFGTLAPHTTNVSTYAASYSGAVTVLVVSPSNAVRQVVYC